MFIPTTVEEVKSLSWNSLDVILISGDAYIDSSFIGVSVLGQILIKRGYRVGIIAQPDINNGDDIMRLGEPNLFWGVTSGSVDSMISNYTSERRKRTHDDFTPGGENNRRPDRAVISYSNLIRRYFKETVPIVLGGIEASLRRVAHYDFWSNSIRRSILFDSRADYLVYGMGERSIIEIADKLKNRIDPSDVKGICFISKKPHTHYIEIPSHEDVSNSDEEFITMYNVFYNNSNFKNAKGLFQKHEERFLIQNPPSEPLNEEELDEIYSLPYERKVHPIYKSMGEVRAINTIQFSITTHRGCFGECSFCSIAVHQGREVISRSKKSIINEAVKITDHEDFKGIINDAGGPTANMFGMYCDKMIKSGPCLNKSCIFPKICPSLKVDHKIQMDLLSQIERINGVKKVFIASGIRYDLILGDKKFGKKYLTAIIKNNISGLMKVAPEHVDDNILKLMKKPSNRYFNDFLNLFKNVKSSINSSLHLDFYFIAAHPGCRESDMIKLKDYSRGRFNVFQEQFSIFTPTPSTYSTLMYKTGTNPYNGKKIFIEREMGKMSKQRRTIPGRKRKYKK